MSFRTPLDRVLKWNWYRFTNLIKFIKFHWGTLWLPFSVEYIPWTWIIGVNIGFSPDSSFLSLFSWMAFVFCFPDLKLEKADLADEMIRKLEKDFHCSTTLLGNDIVYHQQCSNPTKQKIASSSYWWACYMIATCSLQATIECTQHATSVPVAYQHFDN